MGTAFAILAVIFFAVAPASADPRSHLRLGIMRKEFTQKAGKRKLIVGAHMRRLLSTMVF
jgi:hypothetical protein